MKFAILKNDFDDNHLFWRNACKFKKVQFEIIESIDSDWLIKIRTGKYDGILS